MEETTESEYYNTTYVMYENDVSEVDEEEGSKGTDETHMRQTSTNEVVNQSTKSKQKEDQVSLYDEDLYSLPKGANPAEIAEPRFEMDRQRTSDKGQLSKIFIAVAGVTVCCLLAVGITSAIFITLQKDSKSDVINHTASAAQEGRNIVLDYGRRFNITYHGHYPVSFCNVKKASNQINLRRGFQNKLGVRSGKEDNAISTTDGRLRLHVTGNKCEIQGTHALLKDGGVWEYHIGEGKDLESYQTKSFFFHVTINKTPDDKISAMPNLSSEKPQTTKAKVTIVHDNSVEVTTACAGTADAMTNAIHSPNYPSTYNPNEDCTWEISGPSGRQIAIKFNDFQLGPSTDKVTIHDGHSRTSPIINTFNGTTLPADVISTGNSLFVEFISDSYDNYHGFEFQYVIHEYDEYFHLENRTCQVPVGHYPTMKNAMSNCRHDEPCIVIDDDCDNTGKFSLCSVKDLIKSSTRTCAHYKPSPGTLLGKSEKWVFLKIQSTGTMNNENTKQTCEKLGYAIPCYCNNGCSYASSYCKKTFESNSNTANLLAKVVCHEKKNTATYVNCRALDFVCINMKIGTHNGGSWCMERGTAHMGTSLSNKNSLCALEL